MQFEQTHLCEAFATLGAEKRPFSSVNALMSGQVPGVLEAFFTFLAGVWALTCVGPLVTSHIRGTRECFAALLARVRVRPVVDGERLGKLGAMDLLLGGVRCLRSLLEFAVVLWVTVLNVQQQIRLLHVKKRTFRAGEDLGRHLHSGTYAQHK